MSVPAGIEPTAPWELTLEDAAALVARRALSARELLDSVLGRLESTEPVVHAWAFVDPDAARRDADRADAQLARGRVAGPLHGIPFGVKDVIDTAGWPTEAGSRVLAGRVPVADATAVSRLRAAGAVLVGKTVTHEFAHGQDDPPTRSPWDPDRYPGGSSAGSGVAVAVGSALGALGTDTGGSVRNPAAVNGLVGLKPTRGLIGNGGVLPVSPSLDQVGPITRTAAGCALVLAALAEGRPLPPLQSNAPLGACRIGIDRAAWDDAALHPSARAAVERAARELEALGVELVEVAVPSRALALPAGLALSLVEAAEWHASLLRTRTADYHPGTRRMLALGAILPAADRDLARRAQARVRDELLALLAGERLDALLAPTLPGPAPPRAAMTTDLTADGTGDEDTLAGALGLLIGANLSGLPSLAVPCGASPEGLPLGLQLTGPPRQDVRLLRIAHEYQRATDWHERRPPSPDRG